MNLRVGDQSTVPVRSDNQQPNEAEFLAALSAAACTEAFPTYNDAADPVSTFSGLVFRTKRGRPWMKIQDAAQERGVHLSKKEAIRLAQQFGQRKANQAAEGEEAEKGGEGQKSDFSIASTARAVENHLFEPLARGAEQLFENASYLLTSTAHAIIRSASVLSGRLPKLQGEP